MPSAQEWGLALFSNVVHLGLLIYIIYLMLKFHRSSKCQPLQKRSPFLVYLMSTCVILYLFQHLVYKIVYIYGTEEGFHFRVIMHGEDVHFRFILYLISAILYAFSLHGMIAMLIARTWIIYFNTKYGIQIQKREWTQHLNSSAAETFWFLKHRKDFGCNRVIYRCVFSYYFTVSLIITTGIVAFPDIQQFLDIAFYLIEVIVLTVIWNKIPPFYDPFGIKREVQVIVRIAGITLLLYIAYTVIDIIVGTTQLWLFMLGQLVFGVLIGTLAIVLNDYVFHRFPQLISTRNGLRSLLPDGDANTADKRKPPLSLSQVLSDADLLQCLFTHLSMEFSVELLLACIEFQQFHDLMVNDAEFMHEIQDLVDGDSETVKGANASFSYRMSFADEVPQSEIVSAPRPSISDSEKRYVCIAHDLYNKYIQPSSEYEINISSDCRYQVNAFMNKFKDLDAEFTFSKKERYALFTVFEHAAIEVTRLVINAHERCAALDRYTAASNQSIYRA